MWFSAVIRTARLAGEGGDAAGAGPGHSRRSQRLLAGVVVAALPDEELLLLLLVLLVVILIVVHHHHCGGFDCRGRHPHRSLTAVYGCPSRFCRCLSH